MDVQANFTLILQVALAIIGALISIIFNRIQKDLAKLTISVEKLSVKLAMVYSKTESHDRMFNLLKKEF